ncbi:MAG: hypothetical protein WCH82_02345 [Mycobacteriaceae bacterium]
MSLQRVLAGVLPAQTRDDGAVTVAYEGTVASLRTLRIAEDLELISLVQLLAQNVPLSAGLRRTVAAQAEKTTLGTVILVELSATTADVVLRYNFPAAGLSDSALQTLVLMVLSAGAEASRAVG